MNDTCIGFVGQDWGAMDLPPAVTRRGKGALRFKSRNNVTAGGNMRGHGPGVKGLRRRPQGRSMDQPRATAASASLVVIKVDAEAYLVQAVAGVVSQVSELDQWVEVDMPTKTCTGVALACTRSNRGEGGGGCAHVQATAAAVYSGTTVKRLDWRRQLNRLRSARAAASTAAKAEADDIHNDEETDSDTDAAPERTPYFGKKPTPLEAKMRRWEEEKAAEYDSSIGETDSESEANDGDDEGRRTPPNDTPPPFWPPPRGTVPPRHGGNVPPRGSAGSAGHGAGHAAEAAKPSTPPAHDGTAMFDGFVVRWKTFVKGRGSVRCTRVPFPSDRELERMIPLSLPKKRRRTRHRQLLLLLHPDKATSKLISRLPSSDHKVVAQKLKEIAQKMTDLGQSL